MQLLEIFAEIFRIFICGADLCAQRELSLVLILAPIILKISRFILLQKALFRVSIDF